ncbi:iron-sulfur assembly protein 1 [[Candida] anglica]|uniref:Iron-sulfur assembly protein 1 n=1 Tax=[Candida] anglica TaxID=148631 RepID=A0ABP0ECZ5_9ASCO
MIRIAPINRATSIYRASVFPSLVRCKSGESNGKRYMRTIPITTPKADFSSLNYSIDVPSPSSGTGSKWAKHSLSNPVEIPKREEKESFINIDIIPPKRRSRADRFKNKAGSVEAKDTTKGTSEVSTTTPTTATNETTSTSPPTATAAAAAATTTTTSTAKPVTTKKRRALRPRKALITLTPSAISHLKALLDQPEPQLIRIGVRNRGCSGLTYNLEYVNEAGKFDELIEQDGVKVLIDSKALFSIVGSQMDWLDDKLSSRFIFKNPNSKGTCGCGESFMV